MRESPPSFDWTKLILGLAAAVVVFAVVATVYVRAIDAPLIYDDEASIVTNPSITRLSPLSTPLSPPQDAPTAGRPLVNLSFAINYYFDKFNPRWYHVVNVILHALSAMLLWEIVRTTLRLPYFAGRFDSAAEPLALAVALLWAVHPLQTESVVYVTQRTELMVGFFYLSTLYASIRYWLAESSNTRRVWLCLAILAALGGMASKEIMASAPLMALLFDRVFVSGSFRKAIETSWPLYAGLATTWILLLALNLHGPRSASAGFHFDVSATSWWLTQCKVFLMYLELTFWPWPLAIHYEIPYLHTLAAAWPWLLATIVIALGSLVLFWRGYAAGFIGAWVFAILSPTFLVPILTEVAAERRMYLPLAGIISLIVVGGYCLAQAAYRQASNRDLLLVVLTPSLLLVFTLAILSSLRLKAYESSITLLTDLVARQPESAYAHNALGRALVENSRYREAAPEFQKAIELNPRMEQPQYGLGASLLALGQTNQAIAQLQKTLEVFPKSSQAHENLGSALQNIGRKEEAASHFLSVVELTPDNFNAHFQLAEYLLELGKDAQAHAHFQRAVELRPESSQAHSKLAILLARSGRSDQAIEHFQRAVELEPDLWDANFNLANALRGAGRLAESRRHFEKTTQLNPSFLIAWIRLAECNAQLNRPVDAVAAAERALELARREMNREIIAGCEKLLSDCRAALPSANENAPHSKPGPPPAP